MALNAASLKKLKGVKPGLVDVARRAAEISAQPFQIVQGNRTQAEQNALYAQGRTKPGPIVTWTKTSKHIGGRAVDFAALVKDKINWDTRYYPVIAAAFKQAAKELGASIVWGGDWKTKDWGHIQLEKEPATPTAPAGGIGWTIADVQQALIKHGIDPGKVDGILGPKTRAALKAFQAARGLAQTGGPNEETTDALAKQPPPMAPLAGLGGAVPTSEIGSARWAVHYLETLGYRRVEAVALVANLMWESGGKAGKINWGAVGDQGHSHGAAQWNDRHGRWQGYQDFARAEGRAEDDPESQIRYLDHELKTTEKAARKRLGAAVTREDAVKAALTFWRPSIPHADKRQALAEKLEKEMTDV